MEPDAAPGDVFVISAPSGSGKTTICRRLLEKVEDLELSVSYTTRPLKAGERHGIDYFFIDNVQFDKMISLKEFLEFASVYGNRYGTAREVVRSIVSRGRDAVLELDIQGGRRIKEAMPEAVLVGIFPPDPVSLQRRLYGRGRDSREEIEARFRAAAAEMRELLEYDYLVINDDLDAAVGRVECIVRAHRLRRERARGRIGKIIQGSGEETRWRE